MWPRRSSRWSRPAGWPTCGGACRRRWREQGRRRCACCCPAAGHRSRPCCTSPRLGRAGPSVRRLRASRAAGRMPPQPAGLRGRRAAGCTAAWAAPTRTPMAAPWLTTCSASPCWAGWRRTWPAASRPAAGSPELLHAHDWHAAMACAYLAAHPATRCLGIHGAQPGLPGPVPMHDFALLGLPRPSCSRPARREFHGQLVVHEGRAEIRRPHHHGEPHLCTRDRHARVRLRADGVIRSRGGEVSGIPNGVDGTVWDPAGDSARRALFGRRPSGKKLRNKAALRQEMGLDSEAVGAAVRRGQPAHRAEGLDLVLAALPALVRQARSWWCRAAATRCWKPRSRPRRRPTRARWRCAPPTTRPWRTASSRGRTSSSCPRASSPAV